MMAGGLRGAGPPWMHNCMQPNVLLLQQPSVLALQQPSVLACAAAAAAAAAGRDVSEVSVAGGEGGGQPPWTNTLLLADLN